jgi:F0F1-type ATP synthase membrane subunit c/vacuolar-type H+-ATPase subunit K
MGTLFVHGGIGSWFVVLFGLICLVTAALFAWRPDEGRLAVLKAMSLATGFSMLGGFVAGVAKSLDGCARLPPDKRDLWPMFAIKGISEASALLILGLALLTLTWLVVAIGLRRLAARERTGG